MDFKRSLIPVTLTGEEWSNIAPLLPPEHARKILEQISTNRPRLVSSREDELITLWPWQRATLEDGTKSLWGDILIKRSIDGQTAYRQLTDEERYQRQLDLNW